MTNNKEDDKIWFVNDACGIVCCIFSWILLAYAQYAVVTCVILPERDTFYKTINLIVFEVLLFLSTASHFKCVFTDPGTVPKGSATREAVERLGLDNDQVVFQCRDCCSFKPLGVHHCSVCKRCINRMDHHCPWINNCVAIGNQKYFMLFTFYIALVSFYTLTITVLHLVNCIKNDWSHCDSKPFLSLLTSDYYSPTDPKFSHAPVYSIVVTVFLIVKALVFAIFTSSMFGLQVQCIYQDETRIESLKKKRHSNCTNKGSFMKRFRTMLSGFQLNWLSPFTSPAFTTSVDPKSHTHYV